MPRVYNNREEIRDNLKVVPVLDFINKKFKIFYKVYLDGTLVGILKDLKNDRIKIKVKVKGDEEKAEKKVAAEEEKASVGIGLTFDVSRGILTVSLGPHNETVYKIPATSGIDQYMNNPGYETFPYKGPIPVGKYIVDVSNLSDPGLLRDIGRNLVSDWGGWRVPLVPISGKTSRSGFFLHTGRDVGSAGMH